MRNMTDDCVFESVEQEGKTSAISYNVETLISMNCNEFVVRISVENLSCFAVANGEDETS